jgi:glycosyltransferase involved in cell wall biosynthesis
LIVNILFPYLARWRTANWSRYHGLLHALCAKGHQVVILEAPPLPASQETNYADVEVDLPQGMILQELQPPLWRQSMPLDKLAKKGLVTLASRAALLDVVREYDIDVLLLYNFPQYVLAANAPCLTVFDMSDDLLAMFDHEAGRLGRLALHWLAAAMHERLLQRSALVTAPSAVLAERQRRRVAVLPNGVDWEAAQEANGSQIRARYATPIVGFLGAFEYFVDFDPVLAAAAALPDVTFLLVGGGRSWQAVRARVEAAALDNVVLPGPVPHWEGLDYIAAMDIGLIPFAKGAVSHAACPLKLFEYAALRKPVVSTRIAEIVQLAADFVSFADSSQELVAVLRRLLKAPHEAQQRVDRGYELARTRYRWDLIADQFVELVEATKIATID